MNTRMMQSLVGGWVVSLVTVALAQPEAPQPAPPPPTPPPAYTPAPPAYPAPPPPAYSAAPPPNVVYLRERPPDPGRHLHDGFYLRMSLGLGPGSATENISGQPQYKWSGTGIMFDLMLGGSPIPGFVLGGAFVFHEISNPTLKSGGQTLDTSGLDYSLNLSTFGIFTAIYPDPRSGFNLHALLGYGEVSVSVAGVTTSVGNPTGVSFMGGLGYDFWVSDQWSLGPDFRIAYCKAKTTADTGSDEITMFIPTLSFTATYH